MVKVNNLSKSYNGKEVVKGISFHVKKGEILGIMGPNGAGKSTTLETILGTKKMDDGEVTIFGLDPVKNRKEVFNRVGVQFQESGYQIGIKVSEICEFTASLYKKNKPWEKLLSEAGLGDFKNSLVSSLSGGERQKLSILIASIHSPELLFLDELTTGLDPIARRDTWKLIKNLNKKGTTIVLTSHFMDEVEELCDRGIIINNGEILLEGQIKDLITEGAGKNLDQSYINILEGVKL